MNHKLTKNRITKRFSLLIVIILLSVSAYKSIDYFNTLNHEHTRHYVEIKQPLSKKEVLFFYRDDCMYCHEIYPYIAKQKALTNKRITFINLKTHANRKYIKEFNLTQVPALVGVKNHKVEHYIGTSREKIKQFLIKE